MVLGLRLGFLADVEPVFQRFRDIEQQEGLRQFKVQAYLVKGNGRQPHMLWLCCRRGWGIGFRPWGVKEHLVRRVPECSSVITYC